LLTLSDHYLIESTKYFTVHS